MKLSLKSGAASEDSIQSAFFDWVYMMESAEPRLKLCFAIPNGGSRNVIEAKKLKRMGVRAGVPDVFLACPDHMFFSSGYSGLFIEFKSAGGQLSAQQVAFIDRLPTVAYKTVVAYSAVDAIEHVKYYLGMK